MIFSAIILKRTYEKKIIVSVVVIAIAAGFAVPFKDPSVTVLGVLFVSVATFASSAKPVVGELLMSVSDKPKLAPAALVFYDSMVASAVAVMVATNLLKVVLITVSAIL